MFPLAKTCALPRAKTVALLHRKGKYFPIDPPSNARRAKNK